MHGTTRFTGLGRKTVWLLAAAAVLATLSACLVDEQAQVEEEARRFTAVSRTSPDFRPRLGDQVAWYSDLIIHDGAAESPVNDEQSRMIREVIANGLLAKGYEFTESPSTADYLVVAVVLMDDSFEARQIEELIDIHPDLGPAYRDLEIGTLFVAIIPPRDLISAPLYWQGEIQAYTMRNRLPTEVNMDRLRSFVRRLMAAVPEAT